MTIVVIGAGFARSIGLCSHRQTSLSSRYHRCPASTVKQRTMQSIEAIQTRRIE